VRLRFGFLLASTLMTSILMTMALVATASPNQLPGQAQVQDGVLGRDDVQRYIDSLTRDHDFDRPALETLFGQMEIQDEILQKISKPAEKVWTWGRYKKHLVDAKRVSEGVEFWRTHKAALERAEETYGVAPEVVLAILGIETRYGRITGKYPVAQALTTLGFGYPPRAKFFRKELTEFLLLAREEDKDPAELLGSYAGAMGYGQFISSSYRHYAVDFDEDGLRDIWHNPVDAIGSIANYFARHKWQGTKPVAMQVACKACDNASFDTGIKLNSTVGELRKMGVTLTTVQSAQVEDGLSAKLFAVVAEDAQLEYWLVLHDFYVITRYNHSHLYALAVHHIAQAIKSEIESL
jgi:membrane-bound lytic murein transglycosylase B